MVAPDKSVYHKMFQFLIRYTEGFDLSIKTQHEKEITIQEFIAGFKLIYENEYVQYEDWFEMLHELINEKEFLKEILVKKERAKIESVFFKVQI